MSRTAIPTGLLLAILALQVTAVEPEVEVERAAAPAVSIRGAQITLVEEVKIPAREIGVLREITVRPGQRVSTGELLAQLDDVDARLTADQAETELKIARDAATNDVQVRAARKSHQVSLAELKRSLEAVEKISNVISNTELDGLRLTAEGAELAIEQALLTQSAAVLEQELQTLKLNLAQRHVEKHEIRSSLDGVVVQVARNRGEWVEPGTTVFHILRLDTLRCEGHMASSQVRQGMEGRPVRITVQLSKGKTKQLTGRLTYVEPRVNPIKEDVLIWAEFANPGFAILPGMKADMELLAPEQVAKSQTPAK